MAIATSTALALGGMAISAGTAGASFAQAGKQRQLQKQAENEATQALEEARKRLDVNVYEQLGINKEPYALEREALLVQGATGMQAAMEGDERGVAATAGRIQAAQNQAQQQVTSAMGAEMSNLDKLKAAEEARLINANLELDKGQIMGSQLAARDAGNAASAATQAGFTSLAGAAKQGLETLVPLYAKQPVSTGTPNTSLQAMAQQQGLGGSYTAPQFQTNSAFMGGVDPFAINPTINYPTAPVGFNQGAPLPFGGGNPLANATFAKYTANQPYMLQGAGNPALPFNPSKYYK